MTSYLQICDLSLLTVQRKVSTIA